MYGAGGCMCTVNFNKSIVTSKDFSVPKRKIFDIDYLFRNAIYIIYVRRGYIDGMDIVLFPLLCSECSASGHISDGKLLINQSIFTPSVF